MVDLRKCSRAVLVGGLLLVAPLAASADRHDPARSGHPLRVVAYTLHPVGVILDTLIFRPAHWFVHRAEVLETLFGHTGA
jgi:hypothetical protein